MLIAGCGYVGSAVAARLAASGHAVFGLRRSRTALPPGVAALEADLGDAASLRAALAAIGRAAVDAVVYAAAADRRDDEAYRRAYVLGLHNVVAWAREQATPPRRFVFTSSTGVYAQRDGAWVDEESTTAPTHFSGTRMLEAERLLAASGLAATALRLGGIYGPGRTRLVESVRSGRAVLRGGAPRWTNRIHRDDAAGAIAHLLDTGLAGRSVAPLYVAVDDEPTDEAAVLRWLADRLGAPAPAVAADAEPERAASGASNKRCRNARLRASGYAFRYPSFREGYESVLTTSP